MKWHALCLPARAAFLAPLVAAALTSAVIAQDLRPNILWLTCEDMGPNLGCYGDSYATTPNLDRLAAKGLRYLNAWSNAPVCAPARTAIITGVYPTSLGAEHMRSEVKMPAFMPMYPQLLRAAGYYCTNNVKEDYNLTKPGRVWDESSNKAHWKNRPPGKPFFAIFNFTVTHESQIRRRPHTLVHDPSRAPIPPYHPDTPEVRHDWAQYYDNITAMDRLVGERLQELEEAGLAEDTIVFFYSDHGSGMPRHKRWLYESGLKVPLIVYIPEKFRHLAPPEYRPGGVSERLVSFVDLAPSLLSLIGQEPPQWMHGKAFMGKFCAPEQKYIFGFRGRMDERFDFLRAVRNHRYLYIRNYMPHLPYGQHLAYMFETPTTQVWKALFDAGKLQPAQAAFWKSKPPEELYDLSSDPHQINNLVDSPDHRGILEELRSALREHIFAVRDSGFLPEPEMHRRAAPTTIYEFVHDPARYPLEKIYSMAELAARYDREAIPRLISGLEDPDSGVRYWATMGLLIRGQEAVATNLRKLEALLEDESPSVRIVAAWALAEFGPNEARQKALDCLLQLAPADRNGAYTAAFAVWVIDTLGAKAAAIHPQLKGIPRRDPLAPARANSYVGRLLAHIFGEPVEYD
ncbi:MAG: sulfatase-like hydrolase/transferase [Thermoguttaceae bacterium]|nr:sulfatase-like hydrolase/transferase [Thermoguttaceae bacterium]MDW8078116.1 sulfatase-like hydrolase/transferase [Thermoguttaceae bacterium]